MGIERKIEALVGQAYVRIMVGEVGLGVGLGLRVGLGWNS